MGKIFIQKTRLSTVHIILLLCHKIKNEFVLNEHFFTCLWCFLLNITIHKLGCFEESISRGHYPGHIFCVCKLISLVHQEGEKHARRGYWGDILVSPYVALGIQCEQQEFFKKANKQYTKVG